MSLPARRSSALRALLRRALRLHEIECGVDEPDVRETLREVADQAPLAQVVLLGQEAEIVAKLQQALEELDASLLLIPQVGFLPANDDHVTGTVAAIEKELMHDGLVMRYSHDFASPEREGAFIACSYWLADVYVMLGRIDEAVALFERLLKLRNDLGLLSEEYDLGKRRLVGNFPQGFSHIGLINTAFNLVKAQGPAQQRSQRTAPANGKDNSTET